MAPFRTLCLTCLFVACQPTAKPAPGSLPLQIVLAVEPGTDGLAARIRRHQEALRGGEAPEPHLERLGHLFVARARTTFDPGYYRLAEQCAAVIEEHTANAPAALLLRGHVLHSMHDFAAAEGVARRAVAARGSFLDYGLLGDVLLDVGDLEGAGIAYQHMLQQRPCLQSYLRGAQLRYLLGDLEGAAKLSRMATGAGTPRDPEPLAWAYTQRSGFELRRGELDAAAQAAAAALELLPDYAPALLARSRVQWARGLGLDAVSDLRKATASRPEPEYLWALADCLRGIGDGVGARSVEGQLRREGATEDPRTLSLFLASRGADAERAVALARAELAQRQDVFSHDALAWALHRAGTHEGADAAMAHALRAGTPDPRLRYHAGVIASALGDRERARTLLEAAERQRHALLPSEQDDLARCLAAL